MSELFESTGVSVDVENDVVVLRVGDKMARFSYTSAFMVAQRMRLVSNVAGRIAGVRGFATRSRSTPPRARFSQSYCFAAPRPTASYDKMASAW